MSKLYVCKQKDIDGEWKWESASGSYSSKNRPTYYKSKAALARSCGLLNYIECKFYREFIKNNPPPPDYKSYRNQLAGSEGHKYAKEISDAWEKYKATIKITADSNIEEAIKDGKILFYEIDEEEMLNLYINRGK